MDQTRADSVAARRAAILAAVRSLPPGTVAGYGEVAARAGLPGLARLAARVLSELPIGSKVPWHRVLRSDGRVAFPAGSQAAREQIQRLRAEGVTFLRGRAYRPSLDAAVWAPPPPKEGVRTGKR